MVNQPVRAGKYIVAVYNYNGRGISLPCDVSLKVQVCASGSCDNYTSQPSMSSWAFFIFVLAGVPLLCIIPLYLCIRRVRVTRRMNFNLCERAPHTARAPPPSAKQALRTRTRAQPCPP